MNFDPWYFTILKNWIDWRPKWKIKTIKLLEESIWDRQVFLGHTNIKYERVYKLDFSKNLCSSKYTKKNMIKQDIDQGK